MSLMDTEDIGLTGWLFIIGMFCLFAGEIEAGFLFLGLWLLGVVGVVVVKGWKAHSNRPKKPPKPKPIPPPPPPPTKIEQAGKLKEEYQETVKVIELTLEGEDAEFAKKVAYQKYLKRVAEVMG